jgi:hypothetical protein
MLSEGSGLHLKAVAATAVKGHDCEGVTLSLDPPLRFHPRPDNHNKSNINKNCNEECS